MGKTTRIVLLSVSTVLAIVMFLVIWAVRPGNYSAVLEEARNRNQSLLNIDVSVSNEEIRDALLEDGSLKEEIVSSLKADDGFVQDVSLAAFDYVDSAHSDAIQAYVDEHADELAAMIDSAIASYVNDNYDYALGIIDERIQAYVDANYDYLVALINNAVAEGVTDPEAVAQAVMDTIYDDLAAYVSTVDIEALREELVSYFDSRISQVVSDASFSEEQLDSIADALLANEKVQALIDEAKADAVSEALEQYAQNNRQRIVSVPDFSASPIVTTDSDYQAVREAERQAAIQSLLGKMGQ